jgi:hypothetical protein
LRSNEESVDLSLCSYEEFIDYFFNHDMSSEENWYMDPGIRDYGLDPPASPATIVAHMTSLFDEFAAVAKRYSLQQVNAGIWAMYSPSFALQKFLWDTTIAVEERSACIRAMYRMYADFVSKSTVETMENCFYMWWDIVATGWGGFWSDLQVRSGIEEGDVAKLNNESRTLLNAMFETLQQILELPDPRTQSAALHGLGHLHHPKVRELVQRYIHAHRKELSSEGLKWIEQCRDGTVM